MKEGIWASMPQRAFSRMRVMRQPTTFMPLISWQAFISW